MLSLDCESCVIGTTKNDSTNFISGLKEYKKKTEIFWSVIKNIIVLGNFGTNTGNIHGCSIAGNISNIDTAIAITKQFNSANRRWALLVCLHHSPLSCPLLLRGDLFDGQIWPKTNHFNKQHSQFYWVDFNDICW